ncbi:MAG: ATP-dependent Clp protease proteolytic subunit [Candidatus Parcubacteria bacterium]|nr:ATP-dependent Clp protease proteolytic subunit [Candidatus Paceibacterota bacterium]
MPLVPYVIKKTPDGQERGMDIYSRLLDDRIILLNEAFDDPMASTIVAQLLYLESEDNSKDITMYINSPGGSATSMWSIIDTMDLIKCDVSTICTGLAASAGSFVLANGAKGKRFILPNAEVMIHQPLGGAQGQVTDMEIRLKQIIKLKKQEVEFFHNKTGQPREKIAEDIERDYWLDAQEALDYGIVDAILKPKK